MHAEGIDERIEHDLGLRCILSQKGCYLLDSRKRLLDYILCLLDHCLPSYRRVCNVVEHRSKEPLLLHEEERHADELVLVVHPVLSGMGEEELVFELVCKRHEALHRKPLDHLEHALVQEALLHVAEKIQELEAEERKEKRESEDRSYNEIFAETLLLGDSVSQGLYEFGIMNESLVIAQKGIGVCGVGRDGLKECEDRVISANPAKLFLAIGMNDLKAARGNADTFEEDYRSVLQEIEKALPDTEIYINSILPVQSKVIEENSDYGNIPEFNERLAKLCEEEGAVFIDNTDLVKDEYYTADGIHMSPDYYPGWVDHMAEVAKL